MSTVELPVTGLEPMTPGTRTGLVSVSFTVAVRPFMMTVMTPKRKLMLLLPAMVNESNT